MKRASLLLFLGIAASSHADAIDDFIRVEMAAKHLPGVALAIVADGKLVRTEAYGIANLETQTPVTSSSIFKIASLSKQFCAAAIMTLASQGKLSIEDPISKYIADAPATWGKVTLRHLLSHTSGIPNVTEIKEFDPTLPFTQKSFLEFVAPRPLDFEPGERFHYSNTNYSILGWVVGRVSGQPLREYVLQWFFGPAGMKTATYYRVNDLIPNRVNGYRWSETGYLNANPLRAPAMDGSGAVLASVLDLAQWEIALRSEVPVPKKLKDLIYQPTKLNGGTMSSYGLGTYIRGDLQEHTGSTSGFTCAYTRNMKECFTVIVLRNSESQGSLAMAKRVAELFTQTRKTKVAGR